MPFASPRLRRSLATLAALLLFSLSGSRAAAASGLEARLPLGAQLSNPSELNSSQSFIQTRELVTFGADALLVWRDWASGLRFDSISSFKSSGGDSLEVSSRVFSLYLRRSFAFERFMIGPVATLGVYQNSDISVRRQYGPFAKHRAESGRAFSLGAEAARAFGPYILGAELGYQHLVLGSFEGGLDISADLSGVYGKFILGLLL